MKYLYARDIAARRGTSERAARAWLHKLEREHGPRVVGRMGTRLFTTEHALGSIGPGFGEMPARVAAVEERVRRLGVTVRAMGAAIERLDGVLRKLGRVHGGRDVEIDRVENANGARKLRAVAVS